MAATSSPAMCHASAWFAYMDVGRVPRSRAVVMFGITTMGLHPPADWWAACNSWASRSPTLVSPRAGPFSDNTDPSPATTVHGSVRRSRWELLARVWSLLLLCRRCPLFSWRVGGEGRNWRCPRRTISPRGRSSTNSTSRVRSRLSFSCFLSSAGAVVLTWCFGCGGDVQGRKRPRRSRPRSCKPRNPRWRYQSRCYVAFQFRSLINKFFLRCVRWHVPGLLIIDL